MQEEEARELVAAMVENSALESLVQRLGSFNESNDDEAEAVTNTLAIFENIVELSINVGPTIMLTCLLHLIGVDMSLRSDSSIEQCLRIVNFNEQGA